LGDGLLDDPIHDGRDSQQPLATVLLGYFDPANGTGAVSPGFELAADVSPVRPQMGGKVLNGDAIDTRRPLVGFHAPPRGSQVAAGKYRCH